MAGEVSRSRMRRARDISTKKKMYESKLKSNEELSLHEVVGKLTSLELLVQELHYVCIGQWHGWYGSEQNETVVEDKVFDALVLQQHDGIDRFASTQQQEWPKKRSVAV